MASEHDDAPSPSRSLSDNHSSSDSDSGSESSTPQTEWLATTRQKRATAGNRMKSMLETEEPDSDLELLFAEDDDDQGFSDAEAEGSDVQMDSSSDSEDDNNTAADDLEGEQELERQAKEKRSVQRKRKAQAAIPAKFRKKVRIDPAASAPSTAASTPTAIPTGMPPPPPRPKKKSERASWLPSQADLPTRSSSRSTTRESKQQLHAQMQEREEKRLKQVAIMQKKAARMEALKKPPMTQAERLAEAEQVEKRNSKSLNRWEEAERQREEERMKKLRALSERKLEGPVLTFWSGKGTGNGRLVVMEEKPVKKKREKKKDEKGKGEEGSNGLNTAKGELAKTDTSDPGKTAPEARDTGAKKHTNAGEKPDGASTTTTAPEKTPAKLVDATHSATSTEVPSTTDKVTEASTTDWKSADLEASTAQQEGETALAGTDESKATDGATVETPTAVPAETPAEQIIPGETPKQSSPALKTEGEKTPSLTTVQTHPSAEASASETSQTHAAGTNSNPSAPAVPQPADAAPPATQTQGTGASKSPAAPDCSSQTLPLAPSDTYIHDTFMRPIEDASIPGGQGTAVPTETTQKDGHTAAAAPTEGGDDVEFTRNAIIYQNFNDNAIKDKQVQTHILLGRKMTRLAKPTPHPICPITNHPARYRDPSTGIPYYNSSAYSEIQRLSQGEYLWSSALGAWVGACKRAARGVPGRFLNPEEESPNKKAPEDKTKKADEEVKDSMADVPQAGAVDEGASQQSKPAGSKEKEESATAAVPARDVKDNPMEKADVEKKDAAQGHTGAEPAAVESGQPW